MFPPEYREPVARYSVISGAVGRLGTRPDSWQKYKERKQWKKRALPFWRYLPWNLAHHLVLNKGYQGLPHVHQTRSGPGVFSDNTGLGNENQKAVKHDEPQHKNPSGDPHVKNTEKLLVQIGFIYFSDKTAGHYMVGEVMHYNVGNGFFFALSAA
jgi:hypothetical protein